MRACCSRASQASCRSDLLPVFGGSSGATVSAMVGAFAAARRAHSASTRGDCARAALVEWVECNYAVMHPPTESHFRHP